MNKFFYDNEDNNYYMIKLSNENEAFVYLVDLERQTIHYMLSIDNTLELAGRFVDGETRMLSTKEEAKIRLVLDE